MLQITFSIVLTLLSLTCLICSWFLNKEKTKKTISDWYWATAITEAILFLFNGLKEIIKLANTLLVTLLVLSIRIVFEERKKLFKVVKKLMRHIYEKYMNKNNLEQQNDYEFCRNLHLEEQGFSPCPLVGYINSWKKIPFEDGKRFLYEFFIEDEVLGKGYSHYFWAKNFYPYEDEEWLKKILKPGTEIKAHGDYVKVGGTRIKGLKSNWEQWWKKIT